MVQRAGGCFITNAPYTPESMALIERFWRTVHEMATVMLLRSGLGEAFWEDAVTFAVGVYNRVPPSRRDKDSVYRSPHQRLYGEVPKLDDLQPFGCRGYLTEPLTTKNYLPKGIQVVYMGKDFSRVKSDYFFYPVNQSYGSSGHIKWD